MLRPVALCILLSAIAGAAWAGQPPPKPPTKAEVDALIKKAGETPPDWWDSVKLNFPPTLDLTWQDPPKGTPWTPSKWLGQYVWSVINENPGRWKEGARLLHHVLTVNKDDPAKVKKTQNALGRLYCYLLQDYARAAYWWRKAGFGQGEEGDLDLGLCYWRLGSKELAAAELTKYGDDDTRHGGVIKLWADIGELDKALKAAEWKAANDSADIAHLMAGDALRLAGKFTEALACYQKSLAATQCGRDVKQTKARAQANIDAINLYDRLDLKRVPDGTYSAESYSYAGPLTVGVTVKSGKITEVKITKHQDKQYYGALFETPAKIVAKQSVKGIDTFSSATITSEAIVNATAKALAGAMK